MRSQDIQWPLDALKVEVGDAAERHDVIIPAEGVRALLQQHLSAVGFQAYLREQIDRALDKPPVSLVAERRPSAITARRSTIEADVRAHLRAARRTRRKA